MKAAVAVALVVLGVALAGGGYWYGTQQAAAPSGGAAATASPAGGSKGSGERQGKGGGERQGKGGGDASKGGGGGGGPVPVESVKVATAEMPQAITAVGSLRSDESVTLRPEVAGRIVAIRFQEGQRVEKGATLVQLDASVSQAEVQQARTNFELARAKYERAQDLAARNFISGQARDEAKSAFEVAQAAVALVEARFAKTEIKAPFSGIIGLRVVSVGDYVREGADLVNLEAIDPIKVDFRVPENFIRDVKVGQAMNVTLDAIPGKAYEGKVLAVNPLIDAAGRSVVVRAQVGNRDVTLRPGMFARITLLTQARRDALIVPEEALVPQGTENFLFKVVDGRANRIKVETGQRRDGKVEIVSGVQNEDTVVTAGQVRLRDGVAVTLARAGAERADKGGKGDWAGKDGKGDWAGKGGKGDWAGKGGKAGAESTSDGAPRRSPQS
jgi:membrane fusion protein (multidrug efflux system)